MQLLCLSLADSKLGICLLSGSCVPRVDPANEIASNPGFSLQAKAPTTAAGNQAPTTGVGVTLSFYLVISNVSSLLYAFWAAVELNSVRPYSQILSLENTLEHLALKQLHLLSASRP